MEGDEEFLSEWGEKLDKLRDELKQVQSPVRTIFGEDDTGLS